MKCRKCGSPLENDDRFCSKCGEGTATAAATPPALGTVKECPACHRFVASSKSICPGCGRRFDIEEMRKAAGNTSQDKAAAAGCLVVLVGLLSFGLYTCAYESPEELQARKAAEASAIAETAENRRKGFDCLSGWDGSNASLVSIVKSQLRDPDSFEHVETKITPKDPNGQHMVVMTYRARNGFGGLNVNQAMARVDGSTCGAVLITTGE